jgi:hypothetical protein
MSSVRMQSQEHDAHVNAEGQRTARDPVCGMTVAPETAAGRADF